MININDFDLSLIKIDKKSYKYIGTYHIGYITIKRISDYENINSVHWLYLQASKNCVPDREWARIRCPNFIEEPKISGTLLRYVLSYCFLDTSLPYYLPLFLRN